MSDGSGDSKLMRSPVAGCSNDSVAA
jgi:hypothetical protein